MLKSIRRRFRAGQQNWTREQWRSHLLENALSASERAEIEAIFSRSA